MGVTRLDAYMSRSYRRLPGGVDGSSSLSVVGFDRAHPGQRMKFDHELMSWVLPNGLVSGEGRCSGETEKGY